MNKFVVFVANNTIIVFITFCLFGIVGIGNGIATAAADDNIAAFTVTPIDYSSSIGSNIRRRYRDDRNDQDRRRHLMMSSDMECVLYLKDVMFQNDGYGSATTTTTTTTRRRRRRRRRSEESWSCEFTKEQAIEMGIGKSMIIMDIDGITSDLLESKNAISGESIMKMNTLMMMMMMSSPSISTSNGGELERNGIVAGKVEGKTSFTVVEQEQEQERTNMMKLFVPDNGQNIIIESLSLDDKRHANYYRQRRRLQTTTTTTNNTRIMKTLVVRVIDSDGVRMKANTSQLVNDIFEDSVSLRTQYAACSKDQFIIEPATVFVEESNDATTTTTTTTGIVDVIINITAAGNDRSTIQNEAVARAEELYGGSDGLSSRFDLVLFCQPPGTTTNWLAYAYFNRWDSYYNNIISDDSDDSDNGHWCQKVSAQMHEVGHNLGLGHSGNDNDHYGDQSSLMGYSYNQDDTKMCFNAAKNYQLFWFDLQKQSINPLDFIGSPQTYVLNGIDDYKKDGSSIGELITLRLENNGDVKGGIDYFVGYNRASGPNTGTLQGRNQVTIFEKDTTNDGRNGRGKSRRIAALRKGESYKFSQYKDTVYDVIIDVISINDEKDAIIVITVDERTPTTSPTISCGDANELGRFKLELGIDYYGEETSWELKETKSDIIIADEGEAKYISNMEFVEPNIDKGSYCLEEGVCYTFKIQDIFGDGICCDFGYGYYRGILDGITIFEGGEFLKEEIKSFCVDGTVSTLSPSASPTIGSNRPSSILSSAVPTISPLVSKGPSSIPGFQSGPSITLEESNVPSASLSRPPSEAPSIMASHTPTSSQSFSPTDSETMNCKDDKDFRWKGKKKCNWVKRGKRKKRKKKCKKKKNGVRVYISCPAACAKVGLGPCKDK